MKTYAGVGSRKTPRDIQHLMTRLAKRLSSMNYRLHSGGADGADTAFERGAGAKYIWRPGDASAEDWALSEEIWNDYSGREGITGWEDLRNYTQKLMARNVSIVRGACRVVCWTPDGCTSHEERTRKTGGTGMAISAADWLGIHVTNLRLDSHRKHIEDFLD